MCFNCEHIYACLSIKILLQAEKYKCLPDHPMKEKVEGRTKNRIKRSSFTHEIKKLQKDYPAVLTIPTFPLSKQDFTHPCENTMCVVSLVSVFLWKYLSKTK